MHWCMFKWPLWAFKCIFTGIRWSSMCIQMQFYSPMCSVGILLLTSVTQAGACRLKVSDQLLEVPLKSWAIQRNPTEKWKNEAKGIVTFPSPHLAQQHFSSLLMMHVMLREASYKSLKTLDTTGALKKCCSLNFPPFFFVNTLWTNISQRFLEGAGETVRLSDGSNVPMLLEHMLPLLFPSLSMYFLFLHYPDSQAMLLHLCLLVIKNV